MRLSRGEEDEALARALEVAVASGRLPGSARSWGKTVLLEELATVMGIARHALRNFYYRGDPRLLAVLYGFVGGSWSDVVRGLQELQFRDFSPLVWKRSQAQLQASRRALPATLALAQAAKAALRQIDEPPLLLRRSIGEAATEIMACALTFFDGRQRWQLLQQGEQLFVSAMSPMVFESDIAACDAAMFARFWENRATRCGLEWSNVWDDPAAPPTVGMDVVRLAIEELDNARRWLRRRGGGTRSTDDNERIRQLAADKAKWLAKAGKFDRATRELEKLKHFRSAAARADVLLVTALEHIAENRLTDAAREAGTLAEMLAEDQAGDEIASVTSAMMVHNIDLLRGRRPQLSAAIQNFLESSPVAGSEMLNLPRYRERLAALGYTCPARP